MEDEHDVPELLLRRSKRARVQKKTIDGDMLESEEDSEDESVIRRRRKVNRNRYTEAATGFESLIEVVKSNEKLIPQVVKLWVKRYEKDPKPAMAELLTMLIEASGVKYHIQGEFLDETNVDDVVVALVNLAEQGKIEDYRSSKTKEFRSFKENLVSFLDNLVSECQNGPLFDQFLFDKYMDYVIALACTPPRVFRQVGSLVGLQLITSFIEAAKRLGAQRQTTQRQLTAEKKKHSKGPHVKSLNKRLSETHEKITMIEEMMRKIFTGLFVHRYRDIDPEIRLSCIQSLGSWIFSYPSLFLKDLYLKYLGWTLNDKSAGVRKTSVLALQNLYDVDDNVPFLGVFTERFYRRMLDLADDIDISVSVCAISLVKQLLRYQLVPDDDLGSVYDLLTDDSPKIRRAVGALVYDHLIAQTLNSSQSCSSGDGDTSQDHLLRMLQILREFSTDQVPSLYVIDGVWEFMDAMKDWKCITSMLLYENPAIELTDDDTTNLTRLFCASVKKAVGVEIVPAADHRKQNHTKAQRDMIQNSRKDITVTIMKNYPQVMHKYIADKTKVPSLLEIIPHMNLDLYSLKNQDQQFKTLVQLMKETFFKHGDKDALRSCVKAVNYCTTQSQGELQDFAQNEMKDLEDKLISNLKTAIEEVTEGDDEYSLLVNMKRLYELQLTRPIQIGSLYDDIIKVLKDFPDMDHEVVCFLLLNMHLHVNWCLDSILNNCVVSEASLHTLISKRNALFDELEHFLQIPLEAQGKGVISRNLACRVCIILADLWYLFRKSNYNSTKVESLGYCPDISTLGKFWILCEQQLHVSDETEEKDANKEYVEETNRDAVMLAAAKLVATGAVPKEHLASNIISHYVMHGESVAAVVEYLIFNLRKKDEDVSDIFVEALKQAHVRYLTVYTSNDESLSARRLDECKDLARRLSTLFVGNAACEKSRTVILKIVKDGVKYAFTDAPRRLSFLTCAVINFASKLLKTDTLDMLKFVQDQTKNLNTDEDPSGWRPYLTFVESLRAKSLKVKGEREGMTVRRCGRPRKSLKIEGKKLYDEKSSSEEEDEVNASHHDEE